MSHGGAGPSLGSAAQVQQSSMSVHCPGPVHSAAAASAPPCPLPPCGAPACPSPACPFPPCAFPPCAVPPCAVPPCAVPPCPAPPSVVPPAPPLFVELSSPLQAMGAPTATATPSPNNHVRWRM